MEAAQRSMVIPPTAASVILEGIAVDLNEIAAALEENKFVRSPRSQDARLSLRVVIDEVPPSASANDFADADGSIDAASFVMPNEVPATDSLMQALNFRHPRTRP